MFATIWFLCVQVCNFHFGMEFWLSNEHAEVLNGWFGQMSKFTNIIIKFNLLNFIKKGLVSTLYDTCNLLNIYNGNK